MRLDTLRTSRSQSKAGTNETSLATCCFKDNHGWRGAGCGVQSAGTRGRISIVQVASVPFIEVQNVLYWAVLISVVASYNAVDCARGFEVLLLGCVKGCLLTSPSPYIRR